MSSASNSLAREFLIDVNRLCNAVVQRAEAREEEEEETHMAALGQYLVQGRGFTLLTTLSSIMDQELTCREELLTLLLSLLPLVWKIPVQEEKAIDFYLPFTVDICLTKETNSSSLRSTQEKLSLEGIVHPSFQTPVKLNSSSRKIRRQRKITHWYSVRDARKSQLSTSDSEGNSDDKTTIMMKHRRSQILQPFVTHPPRDDYRASTGDPPLAEVVQSFNPDPMSLENSRQIIPTQESKSEVLNESAAAAVVSSMDNSPFDLCHVLLSLLEKVCKFDITLNHSSALAATVVPTLTEFLSGFGDCCNVSSDAESEVVSAGWTEEPVALVQRMLFRTVLHLLSIDITNAETMPDNLRKNLTDLLRAALKIRTCLEKQSDPFAPRYKKTLQEVQDNFVFSKYRHRALLLPELLEGVLQILICCLQSAASNPFYFSQAVDLVHEFIQHQGFKLLEMTVLQMEWLVARDEEITTEASEHLKALINSIMKIISTVKKVKSEQLHQSMCTRKRHRRCEYSHFMHHHRDLSGLPVSAFKNQVSRNPFEEVVHGEVHYPERCCCIAVCAHQCFHLLQQVSLSSTCAQILSGVHNVGICCCMDPKSVITPLLRASKLPVLKNFQQHILSILNKFILDQLGGAEVSQKIIQAACNICTIDSSPLPRGQGPAPAHYISPSLGGLLCPTLTHFHWAGEGGWGAGGGKSSNWGYWCLGRARNEGFRMPEGAPGWGRKLGLVVLKPNQTITNKQKTPINKMYVFVSGTGTKREAGCMVPSSYSSDLIENINQGELIYPEICMLELNLLSAGNPSLDVLAHVFQSFLKVIRQKEKNATFLMQQGTVKSLLGGFLNILIQKDSNFHACQIVLVELLVSLMSSRTCAEELTLLLRIFLEETPCTEILLKGILKIVEMNIYMSPLQYLSFPLLKSSNLNSSSSQKSTSALNSKTVGLLKRAKFSQNKKEADGENLTHQLLSSWHVAPIHLPLVGQNCWPHMSEGFSVSLWFHVECVQETESRTEKGKKKKRSKPLIVRESSFDGTEESKSVRMEYLNLGDKLIEDGCIHIISLGSKALMIQVWADLNTGAFIFRMCMDPNDEMKAGLLAQAESPENIFLIGKWQHLAITYLQQPEGKKNIHGELSLWVCGQRKREINLDYTLPRKTSLSDSNKTFCMVGHCISSQEELLQLAGKWDLGNLLLFNGAKIGPEEAFYLYACGPDFTSIMPCKYGKTMTDYSKYISKDILQCEQIKELFMKKKEVDVGPLIESLAVVYTTCCPAQYTIYEPVIRLKGQVKTVPSQRPFSSKEVQSNLLDPHHLKMLQPVEYKTLQGILHEVGGTGAFVFLFARVRVLNNCEETQALALQVILSLTKYNQQRIQEMENCNGYSMIHQVLIKPKCIVGFHILKTLLEGCCSDEILNINESGQFMLDADSTAVIQDIKLLEELLLDWKIWSKAQQGVWETLLAALEILIRANHHQQMFNIKQLLKAQVVHHFLLTCQVLQEQKEGHLTSLPREVCRSFVKIIEEVLGSPPDLELLTLIFNFLLAVHPPTNTYVCHNPTNFYFSLHIDGKIFQEKVQSIKYLRNSSISGKSIDSPTYLTTSPAGFTASPLGGTSYISVPQIILSQALQRRCKSLPASPTSSPQVHPKRLPGSLGRSIDDLQEVRERDSVDPQEKKIFVESSETLKRVQEELFVSSCESAKTVCDSELTSAEALVDISKEELELSENKELNAELKSKEDDGAAVESLLRRPDNLKGLPSFQKSQNNFAGLGLAFSAQSGSSSIACWPSLTDRSGLPEDWESLTFSSVSEQTFKRSERPDYRSTEDCLVLICCGLYDLLRGVLLILPDIMLEDVIDKLIQPDTLIVLVNHPSPLIQQGVIKLLDAYFNRATREQKEKFLKNRGFSLLANQLYLHQGTQELVECFLEMLFGRSVGLDEEFDMEDVKNAGLFQKWCVIPVLGLVENSLYDNVLLHNSFCLLLQIINSCSKMADMLLDNGLLYVLCNTLAALNGLETNIPLNDYKLLVCDIQQLLVAVTIHACSSSGSQYFRVIEDLIVLLGHLQNNKNEKTQNMAIALQFRVLQAAIELIKATANQDSQDLANSLRLPATHHHAMFQKRKSIAGSLAMKDSIIPRLPKQHFYSYSQLLMPPSFSLLNQELSLQSLTGSTSYTFPTEAGSRKFSLAQSDTLVMKMRLVASDELNMMMQRRMSQENPIRATENELIQRLQRLTVLAVNRFIYQEPTEDCFDVLGTPETTIQCRLSTSQLEASEEEDQRELPNNTNSFLKEMFKMMIEGIKVTSRISTPRQQWRRILWSCKDTFRMQLGRLLVHILSPAQPLQERKRALEIVCETNHQEIMRDCLSLPLQHGPKLALYLYELMHDHKDELTKEEQVSSGVFMNALKFCGYKCISPSAPPKPDLLNAMKEDRKKFEAEECVNKAVWEKTMTNNQQNLSQRLDAKSKDISKIAADITQAVSLSQGMERKKVIQHIRGMYKTDLSASRHWQELVQQLTHDRTLWYDPVCYPTSWQLDPTEGPNRERRRLQRCYLTIPNKYLLRDRQKQEEVIKPPLSYLFEDKTHSSHSSTVKDKAASENIRVNRRCINVAPSRETAGELLLGKYGMYFVEDNASDTVESSSFHGETEPASFSWTYEEIKEVHKRWWQLRDNAVEIFLTNGRTLLLAFDNTKVRDDVYHNILMNNLPNLLEYGNITALTHLWYTGQITNFEYLTHLNKHAGRSFNDLMQYPVFPFILSDYTSETLDLHDPSVYRNLAKPIAVQSKEKEDRYVDTYKYLEEEYRKGAREDDPMPPVQPYHYGSHYSNSGTVLHFLVRMPPFTKMFLAYQDQSFDIPDRTFHSTHTTWRLSSYESMTDVKELIPEFFYLPEFLVNREGFDFGLRQNGERVNHVNLPPWARNDPRLFILIHRQALESDHVSQTICNWIDLVFGYKQKGKASVQAINVFHPATYFGMDVSAVEDPVQRRALETMIKTYGQTPRQLFHTAHVSRPGSRLIIEGELPAAMGLLVQFAFRETREHAKEIVYPSPLPWIKGLKWGEYVGSPSAPDPVVCFSQPHGERFGSLQALPTRAICGLSQKFCLLMIYSKEQGVRSMHSTDIQWSAILSWGYADNILRLKSKQSEPPINFIQSSQLHQVTSCAWVPDSCQLFTGSKSGVITAYMNRFSSNMHSEIEMESQVHLYGHTAEITSLFVCKPYSIMISVSKDGTCIIWDLNRLCYVQSLAGHKSPVTAVSASEMTGDIATVCDSVGGGSDLRLWTVNGDLVGHVHCREIICSVAFSNQPEGVSINVIAGGLENGVVRLWSTWDLKPVREITFPKSNKPIVSLTFSCDGHHLYTANSEGTVIAWCRKDQQRLKLPMFYSFLSSYAAG
uniref:Lysosomal-trafficking regulator n=1 Tax=Terrapene triunguis TaxID=2587831 RepID=A0A674JY58_9SAUR